MKRIAPFLIVLLAANVTYAKAKPKHYDHGTDEGSFGLVAHVKVTRQEGAKCINTVEIGNSEVEAYNFETPPSCLGFSPLSAGMDFKARFCLICKRHFDNCNTLRTSRARRREF